MDVHFKAESSGEDGCNVNRIPSEKRVVDSIGNLTTRQRHARRRQLKEGHLRCSFWFFPIEWVTEAQLKSQAMAADDDGEDCLVLLNLVRFRLCQRNFGKFAAGFVNWE